MNQLNYTLKAFNELTLNELYDILALRQEIFIVEQNCPYQDADYLDQKCWHVLGRDEDDTIVAYTRLVPMGLAYAEYHAIGRVITASRARGKGIGAELMVRSILWAKEHLGQKIKISAQVYAIPFYEKLGFEVTGPEYLEDDIPHSAMILKISAS